jgi:hypothetical protein
MLLSILAVVVHAATGLDKIPVHAFSWSLEVVAVLVAVVLHATSWTSTPETS